MANYRTLCEFRKEIDANGGIVTQNASRILESLTGEESIMISSLHEATLLIRHLIHGRGWRNRVVLNLNDFIGDWQTAAEELRRELNHGDVVVQTQPAVSQWIGSSSIPPPPATAEESASEANAKIAKAVPPPWHGGPPREGIIRLAQAIREREALIVGEWELRRERGLPVPDVSPLEYLTSVEVTRQDMERRSPNTEITDSHVEECRQFLLYCVNNGGVPPLRFLGPHVPIWQNPPTSSAGLLPSSLGLKINIPLLEKPLFAPFGSPAESEYSRHLASTFETLGKGKKKARKSEGGVHLLEAENVRGGIKRSSTEAGGSSGGLSLGHQQQGTFQLPSIYRRPPAYHT